MHNHNAHTCPHCQSDDVSRSRKRMLDAAWRALTLGKRPYRCMSCWRRFWQAPRRAAIDAPARPVPRPARAHVHGCPSVVPGA